MNEIRDRLLDKIEKQFALRGYRDYIDSHFGEALEVLKNDGSIYDLDNIVNLQSILGFHVSYDLYHYMNNRCEEYYYVNISELSRKDYGLVISMCREYVANEI